MTRGRFHHPLGKAGHIGSGLRYGAAKQERHLVPEAIFQRYNAGEKGLSLRDIEINPSGEKKGAYRISRLDIVRISGYFDLACQDDGLEEEPATEE